MDEMSNGPFQSSVETIETGRRPSRWRMVAATATGSVALLGVAAGVGYAAAGSSAGASPTSATTTTTPSSTAPKADMAQRQKDRLNKILQPLVDKGTITASQRDAIIGAIVAAEPKAGAGAGAGHGGPGGRGHGGGPGGMVRGVLGLFGADADAAAKAIGISTDDLKKAVLGGQSLADVAKAHNVDPQKVIDALVAATKAQEAAHPRPNGAPARTDAQITQQITAIVNGTLPKFRGGFGHGGQGGPGGPSWGGPGGTPPAAPGAPATTTPATTVPAPTTTIVPDTTTTAPDTTSTTTS
jgi:hypothetical protein